MSCIPNITRTPTNKPDLPVLSQLRDEEIKLLREVALEDLWTFATRVMWPDALENYEEAFHAPLCERIDSTERGGRKLILLPRQSRKTYLVTVAHSVWRITRDPNIRIILVSALDDTAQTFTQIVKRQFQLNESFLRVFPEMRVPRNIQFGKTYEFTHPRRTNNHLIDPTFRSFYLGAPIAGRRADIILCDDPIEKKHVTTPEQADKALRDFNDLIPIVDRTGKYDMMFVIGTRWAFNDIYGALLGEERGDEATTALADRNRRWDCYVRHALETDGKPDFENGTPIIPTLFSKEAILQILEDYRNDPKSGEEDFWKQMMNVCISPSGRKFEEGWFDTWIPKLPGNIVFSAMLCDSASKDEQVLMRGDFTVVLVAHFDAFGHLYLTDGVRSDKMKGADLIREMLAMQQRCEVHWGHLVSNLVKEKVGEDTFFGWVRAEFARARRPIAIYPLQVRGQGRKVVRVIEALQHPAMARQVHFIEGFPHKLHKVIVDEACHVGQWSHDDAIDALSLAFHPQVRVRTTHGAEEWKLPYSSRIRQISTPPAALQSHDSDSTFPTVRGEEVIWRSKGDLQTVDDGTTRPDPFVGDRFIRRR